MFRDVSFHDFEDYLDDTSREVVAQRIRRLILVIVPILDLDDSISSHVATFSEWTASNLNALEDYVSNYSGNREDDQSFWIAAAICCTQKLARQENSDYDEKVFFVLELLGHLECEDQLFYQAIVFDLTEAEIELRYRQRRFRPV